MVVIHFDGGKVILVHVKGHDCRSFCIGVTVSGSSIVTTGVRARDIERNLEMREYSLSILKLISCSPTGKNSFLRP